MDPPPTEWGPLLELGLGLLYYSSAEFWDLTWQEFRYALRGFRKYGPPSWFGGSNEPVQGGPPPKWVVETQSFMAAMKVKSPDGPAPKDVRRLLKRMRRG